MAIHIRSGYLPFIYNHDPRCPPLGRVVDAKVTRLADGEYALEGEVEMFELGPAPPLDCSDRRMPIRDLPYNSLLPIIDRVFSGREYSEDIVELAKLLGSSPQFEGKKSLDPIAVLAIGGAFYIIGKFADSFFSRLGSNTADALSTLLKRLVAKKHTEDQERLLRMEFAFQHEDEQIVAEVILSGPNEEDIDRFIETGIQQLDQILPRYLGLTEGLVRYVFSYSEGKVTFTFAVRRDAIPIFPARENN